MNWTAILALLLALVLSNVLAWTVVVVTRAFNRDDLKIARDWSARMTGNANEAVRDARSARLEVNAQAREFAKEKATLVAQLADAERRARRRQRKGFDRQSAPTVLGRLGETRERGPLILDDDEAQSRTGQRAGETVSLESVRDPDFTGGLDPVEYLNRLHAGVGDHDKDCACAECLECRPARARSTSPENPNG